METKKTSNKTVLAGVLTAIGASICCIVPVLALIAGSTGFLSTFSWIEPFRPYLIALTIFIISFAWYQKLKPKHEIDCACEENEKPSFWQSKKFLVFVTLFAGLMLTFPYYSHIFYSQPIKDIVYVEQENIVEETFAITGMTCAGCASHIQNEVGKLNGIISVKASYEMASAIVKYDKTKVDLTEIQKAINSTGYKVVNH
ncbi:mercuric transport protein MerTP [Gramella sp. AN32]|uniref:Mercuric transport protein MerT n=1 Tax=Christiangramia antarctica TaxID=2058158 RepID=A0ABW5X2I2_9FLAO|nr:mercuric transport protein MerTP [Gramella sp. AN32]MCM4157982.1 mercuric transport protein MerTP [Gramella sp. AN32]